MPCDSIGDVTMDLIDINGECDQDNISNYLPSNDEIKLIFLRSSSSTSSSRADDDFSENNKPKFDSSVRASDTVFVSAGFYSFTLYTYWELQELFKSNNRHEQETEIFVLTA
ncbi:hypothetical protein FQA39_LY08302 [Lamprigera yunnana]|nr:hypothetical protein FQA39_LY08302 [Lamprigera yunnana]